MKIFKVKFRRFIAKYFYVVVKLAYSIKFNFFINLKKKPPIIILTPGKTGSSSVYFTLKRKLKDYSVFHIHYFTYNSILKSKKDHLSSNRKSLPLHLITSELLLKKINNYKGRVKIITILRDPISRSVSSFFQNIDFYKNKIEDKNLKIDEKKSLKIINEKIIYSSIEIEDWISNEIYKNFSIDIYRNKFPNKKFIIINKNEIDFLLLRMEDLNNTFAKSTKLFFDLSEELFLEDYNIGFEKYYSKQYKSIKSKVEINKKDLDIIIASKFIQHFYFNEINNIVNKYKINV